MSGVEARSWPPSIPAAATDGTPGSAHGLLGDPARRAAGRRRRPAATSVGVRAALDDPALVDDDDLVGVLGGREPVRDRDRGAAAGQPLQGPGDPHLEGRVDGAGRLVEDQQVGVGEVRADQGDQLPLPRRQRLAALPDLGVEAARQGRPASRSGRAGRRRRGSPRRSRRACRRATLARSVASNRKPSCGTSTTRCAQRRERHLAQVDAVEPHGARGRVHQPGQQLGQRGLARAGLADDRDPGVRRRSSRSMSCSTGGAAGVGEPDVRRTAIVDRPVGQPGAGRRRGRRRRPGCRGCRSPGASRRWRSGRR